MSQRHIVYMTKEKYIKFLQALLENEKKYQIDSTVTELPYKSGLAE